MLIRVINDQNMQITQYMAAPARSEIDRATTARTIWTFLLSTKMMLKIYRVFEPAHFSKFAASRVMLN